MQLKKKRWYRTLFVVKVHSFFFLKRNKYPMTINTSGDLILSFFFWWYREREKNPKPLACKVENYEIVDRGFNLDVD